MQIETITVEAYHNMDTFCQRANEAVNKRSDELAAAGHTVHDVHVNTYSMPGVVHFVYTLKYT